MMEDSDRVYDRLKDELIEMADRRKVERDLSSVLGFRVTPVGNRKIQFVAPGYNDKGEPILKDGNTRPATVQESLLWDYLVTTLEDKARVAESAKQFLPGKVGVDAHEVRDSLGNKE